LEVLFELSSEGTLTVRATDINSGQMRELRIEARPELASAEVEKLRSEQGEYAEERGKEDAALAAEAFRKLLEKGEKLAKILETSAKENPGPDAQAAVDSVRTLLNLGKSAVEKNDVPEMAQIGRRLQRLINPKGRA
jgi:molecular chaperone DnaK